MDRRVEGCTLIFSLDEGTRAAIAELKRVTRSPTMSQVVRLAVGELARSHGFAVSPDLEAVPLGDGRLTSGPECA